MRRLTELSISRPGRTLWIAAAVTFAAALGLTRLELRTDGRALIPAHAAEVETARQLRARFDLRDPIVVLLRREAQGGVYHPPLLRLVVDLTDSLRRLEGVRPWDVVSLATEQGFRHRQGSLRFRVLLEPLPESPVQLEELRSDLKRIGLYDGTLVSADGQSVAILVGAPPERRASEVVHEIRELTSEALSALSAGDSVRAAVIGAPVAEAMLGRHILADLGLPRWLVGAGEDRWLAGAEKPWPAWLPGMAPIAILVMALVFYVAFRRVAAVLLPLGEIGVCLVVVFGLMGWTGTPVYLTTAVLPVILAAVGVADEIHILHRWLGLAAAGGGDVGEGRDLVRRALRQMSPPVVQTSITTAVAFLSFTLSPLVPVRAFGLFTTIGVIVCMIYSLTVIPAQLALLGPERFLRRKATSEGSARSEPRRLFAALARWGARHRPMVRVVVLLLVAVSFDGVRRVRVQDSWIDGFAPGSSFSQATRYFDRQFLGSHLLRLGLSAEAPRLAGEVDESALGRLDLRLPAPETPPEFLRDAWVRVFQLAGPQPREWTTWVESASIEGDNLLLTLPARGGSPRFWLRPEAGEGLGYEVRAEPLGSPAVLERVGALEDAVSELPGVGGVLGPAAYLETVSFFHGPDQPGSRRLPEDPRRARVMWNNYARMRGAERLGQLVNEDRTSGLVTVFLEDANFIATGELLTSIRSLSERHLAPVGIRIELGGDVAESQALIDAVVSTQVRSVLLSLVGILLVAALLTGSPGFGLLSVLPPAFAVLVNFAAMGWLDVPLGVATSMFAGMTLGVGVDFAIHLQASRGLAASRGLSSEESGAYALATTGPAIVIDALAVGLGFGVLALSQVPANARLGGLLMASVLGCLVATLLFLPALWGRTARP